MVLLLPREALQTLIKVKLILFHNHNTGAKKWNVVTTSILIMRLIMMKKERLKIANFFQKHFIKLPKIKVIQFIISVILQAKLGKSLRRLYQNLLLLELTHELIKNKKWRICANDIIRIWRNMKIFQVIRKLMNHTFKKRCIILSRLYLVLKKQLLKILVIVNAWLMLFGSHVAYFKV